MNNKFFPKIVFIILVSCSVFSCRELKVVETQLGLGWSKNSVNTVIFRGDALVSYKDCQFTSYYNADGYLVLGKRELGTTAWETKVTPYQGNVKDAHNAISMMIDAEGYVHVSWDMHNTKLRYAKSTSPLGLQLTEELSMTGKEEDRVTYPEFFKLPDGSMFFCYRSGESGRGNMVINAYNTVTKEWGQIQNNLLDGEGERSAYWQTAVSADGAIHISWVWRETWDVSTNHDMHYAVSYDKGKSWQKSTGEKYELPIHAGSAEVVWKIPQNSSLINQTAMAVNNSGNVFIATYWAVDDTPEYKVIYNEDNTWKLLDSDFHQEPFLLGGGGTKSIPISRPKVLVNGAQLYLLYRDEESENKIMLGYADIVTKKWNTVALTNEGYGQWEPNFDKELWQTKKQLHVFAQKVVQADAEGVVEVAPNPVKIIEITNLPD